MICSLAIEPICVDLETAAHMLSVSPATLQGLVRKGLVKKPRQISKNRVGYRVADLREYVEACPESQLLPPPKTDNRKGTGKAAAEVTA